MKNEKVFSKNGFYTFVLESNLLLHKHVAARGQKLLSQWLSEHSHQDPVKLLDIACGGNPVSVSTILSAFPEQIFHYTGVDINPDQVEATRTKFQFPENVHKVTVLEGNAWDFSTLPLENNYDIIFTGLNLHHGTPEEIYCLLLQCRKKLASNGLFINHDFYRPAQAAYLRRPQVNPSNPKESFAMISNETLAKFPIAGFNFPEAKYSPESDWRKDYVNRAVEFLKTQHAEESGIQEMLDHVMNHDFPISVPEMTQLTEKAGFALEELNLDAANQPLEKYLHFVAATPK